VRPSIFATASFLAVPWLCRTLSVSVRFSSRSPTAFQYHRAYRSQWHHRFQLSPVFASTLSNPADVMITRFGTFDTVPAPGEKIVPINYGTTSRRFTLNVRLGKTFGFGRKPEAAPTAGGPGGGPGSGKGGAVSMAAAARLAEGFGGMGTPTIAATT